MLTRKLVTHSGPISRISTALKMNEQPQMAPSRMIQNQSRIAMAIPLVGADATPGENKGRTDFHDGHINSGDGRRR